MADGASVATVLMKIVAAKSFSDWSTQVFTCIGAVLDARVELTIEFMYAGVLDIRNNVVYNWTSRTTDGGVARMNYVNNYYKPYPKNPFVKWLLRLDPIDPAAKTALMPSKITGLEPSCVIGAGLGPRRVLVVKV